MDLQSEAYQQNYQQFRHLNQIMWQIPVLAMSLTGGLWFGVSKIEDNLLLVSALLLTAILGNLGLVAILFRFRHVMGCYLAWLKKAAPEGYVDASANHDSTSWLERFANRDKTVRNLFSYMLIWAALCSGAILAGYWINQTMPTTSSDAIAYYDQYAEALVDSYEAVPFEKAYPFLKEVLGGQALNIVDVGSGTGRDAAWLANHGHTVTAVEPSSAMRAVASRLHSGLGVEWLDAKLPELASPSLSVEQFDLALVSAVWMHLAPEQRKLALERLLELLKPGGLAFVTFRLGPDDEKRAMYALDPGEFVDQATMAGFSVVPLGEFDDILDRPDVSWRAFRLEKEQ